MADVWAIVAAIHLHENDGHAILAIHQVLAGIRERAREVRDLSGVYPARRDGGRKSEGGDLSRQLGGVLVERNG